MPGVMKMLRVVVSRQDVREGFVQVQASEASQQGVIQKTPPPFLVLSVREGLPNKCFLVMDRRQKSVGCQQRSSSLRKI